MYVTLSSEFSPATKLPDSHPFGCAGAAPSQCKRQAVGTHLFREGDIANNIYEITSGVFRLTRVLGNGRRQVIAFGLPGDIIGFPNGISHHSDCEAIQSAEVVAHRRTALDPLEGDDAAHQRLLHAALREISAMQDHFMMLARKSATEKVASFLINLAERVGTPIGTYTACSLPMSRADIADFLGLRIETVSRTFTRLRKEDIIALDTSQIVLVKNMGALVSASEASS
ncbi:Transcriptional activatory protein AadR (plasmid) [Sulfitobacter sp. DSM 110093]|uniref:helix-turn-helix domain-containing protein n=1 Tax=Sulfitobacter sp. DSM 110093 TaxID=2883127 RepID=UPI001FAC9791|nr:helix-turn-helix domain-containing protein [Sulfitobacter sp. DSM 110093]UOA33636.1 Transcriptional activatory protein AadR [Sulfitobacter sp. DSM 110093]